MKRFIIFLSILAFAFSLAACEAYDNHFDNMYQEYIESFGFKIIEKIGSCGDYRGFLVYDTRTNVEYIATVGNGSNGFCPYYGKDGNVVIYGGK